MSGRELAGADGRFGAGAGEAARLLVHVRDGVPLDLFLLGALLGDFVSCRLLGSLR